ncbi:uncharacterized protein LOC122804120 [Protopterus annectens]|uniref:uncharacterized protein LOC122804120 n=1 Tax=Protopterus annectens TaxID=7888 RepID=UPI001CFBD23A|nr:uncharacterized protein LOC122804120 [Protopterus annectens]
MADVQDLAHPSSARKNKTKKKKRKARLTKEQRKLAKLEKACKVFQQQEEEFLVFQGRMDKWLKDHHHQALELFGQFHTSGTGLLSHEEFKLGMRDLNIPCTEAQLHMLIKLLDPGESGVIDYVELSAGLQQAQLHVPQYKDEEKEDHNDEEKRAHIPVEGKGPERKDIRMKTSSVITAKEQLHFCGPHHLVLSKPSPTHEPRLLVVEMRLITFDNFTKHPGHFQEVVNSESRVHGLIQRIRERTGIESTKLQVFRDKSFSKESYLHPVKSLQECGFQGGPPSTPDSITLYYDYIIEIIDCPLLNCDYYFRVK